MTIQTKKNIRQQGNKKTAHRAVALFATAVALAVGAKGAEAPGYMATNAAAFTGVNPETGAQAALIPVPSPISSVVFSSSGKTAFTANYGTVTETDIETRQVVKALPDAAGAEYVVLSPDNQILYAYNTDTSLTVFNVASGSVIKSFPRNTLNAFAASAILSPDGSTVWLLATYNRHLDYLKAFFTLTAIDTHTLQQVNKFRISGSGATQFAVTTDNTSAFVVAGSNMLQINLANGSSTYSSTFPVAAVQLDGSDLLVASGESVAVFSTQSLQVTGQVALSFAPGGLSISPDKTTLYAYAALGADPGASTVQPISVSNLTLGAPFTLPYPASAVAVNPANGFIWSASNSPAVTVSFNAADGALLATGESLLQSGYASQGLVAALKVLKVYESNPSSAEIEVFDAKTLKLLTSIPITQTFGFGGSSPGAVSPNGSMVFLGYSETIQAVNTATDTIAGVMYANSGLSAVAVSPDSKTIYSAALPGYAEGLIEIFDTATFQPSGDSCCGFTQNFVSLMVSPDGKTLYAVGPDPTGVNWLYVFDAQTLEIQSDMQVAGSAAVLSKDGTTIYLLESSAPNTLAIQVINTGSFAITETYPITGPSQLTGASIALSLDGTELYVSAGSPLLSINVTTGAQTNSPINFFGPIVF
jgi:WD40 repeat protein